MSVVRIVFRLVIHPFNLACVCALALGASPAATDRAADALLAEIPREAPQ